jgi:hypothetical protein
MSIDLFHSERANTPARATDVAKLAPRPALPAAAQRPVLTPGQSCLLRTAGGEIMPPGEAPELGGDQEEWDEWVDEFITAGGAYYENGVRQLRPVKATSHVYGSGHAGTPSGYANMVPYGHIQPWTPTPLMSEMGQNLWQGGVRYKAELPEHFRHVLNMTPGDSYVGVDKIDSYLRVPTHDTTQPGKFDYSKVDYLADWVNERRQDAPVLVHCAAGLNRSGIVVARAIMKDENISAKGTIEAMRKLRVAWVLSNKAFEAWLRGFDFDAFEMLIDKDALSWNGS